MTVPKAEKIKAKGAIEAEKPTVGLSLSPPAEQYHHIRIRSPGQFDKLSFRVITFDKGIKATVGCPKGKYHRARKKCKVGTQVQKLLFPKTKYTEEEAKTWVKKHPKLRLKKKGNPEESNFEKAVSNITNFVEDIQEKYSLSDKEVKDVLEIVGYDF